MSLQPSLRFSVLLPLRPADSNLLSSSSPHYPLLLPGLQERVKQAPCPTQVAAALDFLAGLGIGEPAELGTLVATFPEALGLRVELMQDNVQVRRFPCALLSVLAAGLGCETDSRG